MPPPVQAPPAPSVSGVEDDQQQYQRQRIQPGPKVAPQGRTVPRLPPRSQDQIQQEQEPNNGGGAHPQPEEETYPDQQLDNADGVPAEDRMWQYQTGQHRAVESNRSCSDVIVEIFLKLSVSKAGAGHLIFAKQQEQY